MTNQQVESVNQERRNSCGTLETTRLLLGRLALSKGEGEAEGCSALLYITLKPLASTLFPCSKGEAEKISIIES